MPLCIVASSRRASLALAGATFLLWTAAPALASDYSNVCRSADGSYEIDDGVLRRAGGNVEQAPIPFTIVEERVLSRETGFCIASQAGGTRFNYETKTSTLRATFRDGSERMQVNFICEFASDGLPAAYNCDRRVVTSSSADKQNEPEPPAQGAGLWMHNGSIMRLEASGTGRRFYYEVPREGMRNAGTGPGTLLFDGTRDGARYSGTAYIFAAGCRPQPYAVEGVVSDGDQRVVMTGEAPRIGAGCRTIGYREDTLVFTLKPDND